MATKTVSMPEDVVINLLRTLPEEDLIDIFWKSLVKSDVSPLTEEDIRATLLYAAKRLAHEEVYAA